MLAGGQGTRLGFVARSGAPLSLRACVRTGPRDAMTSACPPTSLYSRSLPATTFILRLFFTCEVEKIRRLVTLAKEVGPEKGLQMQRRLAERSPGCPS